MMIARCRCFCKIWVSLTLNWELAEQQGSRRMTSLVAVDVCDGSECLQCFASCALVDIFVVSMDHHRPFDLCLQQTWILDLVGCQCQCQCA